ncbi:MAG: peptidylprolyl isomerase [Endomicrobium sp.]|jgi:parvulin-like peptidyl-prolyl isomerase|nr:peptidylprolyl isomerase [Endomicrobium sp.]
MNRKIVVFSMLFGFSLLVLVSCKNKEPVIAKVGKTTITESMVEARLATTPPAYQNYANTPLGRRQFIDTLLRETVMIEAAKQAKVNKSKEYKDILADFAKQQKQQFDEYRDGLMLEMYLKQIQEEMIISDADAQAYYNANSAAYQSPISYTVRHILVTDRAEADKAYDALQKGESFEKVVQEYSQDKASVSNGGLIGPFRIGALVPEFEKAALSLKNGETSNIVETNYGYHIIRKVSQQNLPTISYEQAEPEIKGILARDKFERWFETKKEQFKVKVDYDLSSNASQGNKK